MIKSGTKQKFYYNRFFVSSYFSLISPVFLLSFVYKAFFVCMSIHLASIISLSNSQLWYTYFLFSTNAQLTIIIFWSFDCKFCGPVIEQKKKKYQNIHSFISLCKTKMSRVFPRCFFVLDIYVMCVVGFVCVYVIVSRPSRTVYASSQNWFYLFHFPTINVVCRKL